MSQRVIMPREAAAAVLPWSLFLKIQCTLSDPLASAVSEAATPGHFTVSNCLQACWVPSTAELCDGRERPAMQNIEATFNHATV